MTEAWSKLRISRARLSPSGPVPVPGPRTGPSAEEQFAALAVLAAIAEQQGAAVAAQQNAAVTARQNADHPAAAPGTRPPYRPQHAAGDQLASLLAEIETAQHKGSQPY